MSNMTRISILSSIGPLTVQKCLCPASVRHLRAEIDSKIIPGSLGNFCQKVDLIDTINSIKVNSLKWRCWLYKSPGAWHYLYLSEICQDFHPNEFLCIDIDFLSEFINYICRLHLISFYNVK